MKKFISLVLSAMLVVSMMSVAFFSASAATGDYTVAGDEALTGVSWDPYTEPNDTRSIFI